ncbi:hypothetical protein [Runella sp.]|uniref:hypothetical protein n=1 Tax=Runella sp. TaxID=1960881 RepID=UPI003D11EB48
MLHPITGILVSIISFVIGIGILYFYYTKKITVIEAVVFAFATETFNIEFIGPTIGPSFFVSYAFFFEAIYLFLIKKITFSKEFIILLILPLIASLFGLLWHMYNPQIFAAPYTNSIQFYTKPIYFYIKNYLPFFSMGYKIYLDRSNLSFALFNRVITRVAIASCVIGLLQILFVKFIDEPNLSRLIGSLPRYRNASNEMWSIPRVSALFNEPKNFSAFIGIALPIIFFEKRYTSFIFVLTVAVLSLSQTFWVIFISAVFVFFIFKNLFSIRKIILSCISLIIAFFLIISSAKSLLVESYLNNRENLLLYLIAERAVSRLEVDDITQDNEFLGMPLQRDMEYPIYKFISDYPILLLTGYGPGNFSFVDPNYFSGIMGDYIYNERAEKFITYNVNMRWYYWIVETGIISFLIYFMALTKANSKVKFQNQYYSFLWLAFFFTNIDAFIIMYYLLIRYEE